MNPQEFTAQQASDPNSPGKLLQEIAQNRSDLWSALLSNPSIYPELRDWILSQQGQSTVNVEPVLPAANQDLVQPVGATQSYPQPYTQASNDAYLQTQPFPDYGQVVPDRLPKNKKRRRIIWITIVAALLLAIGGVSYALYNNVFKKLKGADTPQAAVERLIDGLNDSDAIAIYGITSPLEVADISNFGEFFKQQSGKDFLTEKKVKGQAEKYLKGLDVEISDYKYEVTELGPDAAAITFSDANVKVSIDPEKLADALYESSEALLDEELLGEIEKLTGESFDLPSKAAFRSQVKATFGNNTYTEFSLEQLRNKLDAESSSFKNEVGNVDFDANDLFTIITVREGGEWYISPYLSVANLSFTLYGKDLSDINELDLTKLEKGADSPEQAAQNLTENAFNLFADGDLAKVGGSLPTAQQRVLHMFLPSELPFEEWDIDPSDFESIDVSAKYKVLSKSGDTARVGIDEILISSSVPGQAGEFVLTADCVAGEINGENQEYCLEDIPLLKELGLDEFALIAIKEEKGWTISGMASNGDFAGTLYKNVIRILKEGNFTDPIWLEEQLGVLADYMY